MMTGRSITLSLRDDYAQECWDNCTEAERRIGYSGTWWKTKMRAMGEVEASLDLVRKSNGVPQSGFRRLLQGGYAKLTVEYCMLKPEWRPLFADHPQVLDVARFVLRQEGVTPPDEDPEEGGTSPGAEA
jgi:hypothetical protein